MSSLRILGLSYLATASLFTLAIVFSDHAALRLVTARTADQLAGEVQARLVAPMLLFARLQDEKILDPQVALPVTAPGPNDARTLAHSLVPALPQKTVTASVSPPAEPFIIAPDLPTLDERADSVPPPLPKFAQPDTATPVPPDPSGGSLTADERAAVTARLSDSLTPEMLKNFDLFLYVSKAKSGPLAQRLYVFKKDAAGNLVMAFDWAASTGREQYEISPLGVHTRTDTPAGFYELDPDRMYRAYHSHAWDQSMPYAMFFNWEHQGEQTGLAIHSAVGDDIARLGARASAGCVHISPAHAQELYEMIRTDYRGKAPRFAYNRATHSMSNKGDMMRDANGDLVMADGYRVLINIEDFGGINRLATLN